MIQGVTTTMDSIHKPLNLHHKMGVEKAECEKMGKFWIIEMHIIFEKHIIIVQTEQ